MRKNIPKVFHIYAFICILLLKIIFPVNKYCLKLKSNITENKARKMAHLQPICPEIQRTKKQKENNRKKHPQTNSYEFM